MNVTPSKVLLAVSLAGLTYCNWDYLSRGDSVAAASDKPKDSLSSAINHTITLALAGDPFNSRPIDRGSGNANFGGAITADGVVKTLPDVELQAIFLSGGQRIAMVNGKSLREGEMALLPNGPLIRAVRVGEDSVMIEANGQISTIKLADSSAGGARATAAQPQDPAHPNNRAASGGNDNAHPNNHPGAKGSAMAGAH
jgi:hypothetical protein